MSWRLRALPLPLPDRRKKFTKVPDRFRSNATLRAQWQFLDETYPAFNPPIGTIGHRAVSCCGVRTLPLLVEVFPFSFVHYPGPHAVHMGLPSPTPALCTDEENEHFIVWMRTAALPNFRKLYGKIEKKVEKGQVLTFTINPCTCPRNSLLVVCGVWRVIPRD